MVWKVLRIGSESYSNWRDNADRLCLAVSGRTWSKFLLPGMAYCMVCSNYRTVSLIQLADWKLSGPETPRWRGELVSSSHAAEVCECTYQILNQLTRIKPEPSAVYQFSWRWTSRLLNHNALVCDSDCLSSDPRCRLDGDICCKCKTVKTGPSGFKFWYYVFYTRL